MNKIFPIKPITRQIEYSTKKNLAKRTVEPTSISNLDKIVDLDLEEKFGIYKIGNKFIRQIFPR